MKPLDDMIREAAANGWLSGLRIDQRPDGQWQVSAPSRFGKNAWSVETSTDVIAALRDALAPYGEPVGLSVEDMLE